MAIRRADLCGGMYVRNEDDLPEAERPAEPEAAIDNLTSRRAMLRIGALGSAAVFTVRPGPGLAQVSISAITCSVPVPQSSQANKWIKSDGTVVNPNTANSFDPPDAPLKGEDVKNSLAYGTRYTGYNQNATNAFNNYIKKLTMGKQGYTCYSSIQGRT